MKTALIFILGAIFVHEISGEKENESYVVQSPTTYVQDLPSSMISQILTILYNGTVHLVEKCTTDKPASRVRYWLYTRKEPKGQLISLKNINFKRPTVILLHGWVSNRNGNHMVILRKAFLRRFNANVIMIDYGYYVQGDYFTSCCNLAIVSQNFAQFLCELNKYRRLSRLHLVGHSLGAQLAALSGYSAKQQGCGTIGRITGLDPAGPLFQDANTEERLDPSDANFVDVVHTNQGQYGYIGNAGDVDFYGNCGTYQPGCLMTALQNVTLKNILSLPLLYLNCNHERSCYYFAESITKNSFYSTAILDPLICIPNDLNGPDHTYMGEYCTSKQNYKSYNFETNAEPPYGQGPDGPLR